MNKFTPYSCWPPPARPPFSTCPPRSRVAARPARPLAFSPFASLFSPSRIPCPRSRRRPRLVSALLGLSSMPRLPVAAAPLLSRPRLFHIQLPRCPIQLRAADRPLLTTQCCRIATTRTPPQLEPRGHHCSASERRRSYRDRKKGIMKEGRGQCHRQCHSSRGGCCRCLSYRNLREGRRR